MALGWGGGVHSRGGGLLKYCRHKEKRKRRGRGGWERALYTLGTGLCRVGGSSLGGDRDAGRRFRERFSFEIGRDGGGYGEITAPRR